MEATLCASTELTSSRVTAPLAGLVSAHVMVIGFQLEYIFTYLHRIYFEGVYFWSIVLVKPLWQAESSHTSTQQNAGGGDNKVCHDTDECQHLVNGCGGDSKCVHGVNDFVCHCADGWQGLLGHYVRVWDWRLT